jgi:hypothetical protein
LTLEQFLQTKQPQAAPAGAAAGAATGGWSIRPR